MFIGVDFKNKIIMASNILSEVESLLKLLDSVEESIRSNPSPLKSQSVGVRLASRLRQESAIQSKSKTMTTSINPPIDLL